MCYYKSNGTYDLVGIDSVIWKNIINTMISICDIYNYNYIKTPIFESRDLFFDIIGENTDIISKELYNFYDKNNNHIALRPEGTTGVVRSYIENKIYLKEDISKFYYYGSMFRNENVEKGRYREFQQFGVEVFNNNSVECDVEVISLAVNILKKLRLVDIKVYINNLGSKEDKEKYESVIKEYFKPYLGQLCNDCKKRFIDNPIRILDCKIDKRKDFVINAPKIDEYINIKSKNKFNRIISQLDKLNIDYEINKNLVRGLNYYTDTVFEIKTNLDGYGSCNTICGGGRYNSSVITEDNQIIPAIGFAIGIERLIQVLKEKNLLKYEHRVIDYNIKFNDIELLNFLRKLGYKSDYNSNEYSNYIIEKSNEKYILIDNINNHTTVLDYSSLLEKIKNS